MKVILLQEVKGRGGEGDVVEVARGFAVNYLLPRKIAVEATSGNLKQLEARMDNIRKREESRVDTAQGLANALDGKSVVIGAKVGEEGRLFGSITAPMIEDAIAEQLDVDVDKRKIEVHGHIKEVGEHEISVQVYREIKATVTVNVVAEGTVEAMMAEAAEAISEAEGVVVPHLEDDSVEAEEAPESEEVPSEIEDTADEVAEVEEVAESEVDEDAAPEAEETQE